MRDQAPAKVAAAASMKEAFAVLAGYPGWRRSWLTST